MKYLPLLFILFVAKINCNDHEKEFPRAVDFYVELTNFDQDKIDFSLEMLTEAYEKFNADVPQIIAYVYENLEARYPEGNWFAVANYEQAAQRYGTYLSVHEKVNGDKFTIGTIDGCEN